MQAFTRTSLAVLLLAATASSAVEAQQQQRRQKEVRFDLATVNTLDGTTFASIGTVSTVALAIYMNNSIAIEPTVNFSVLSGDGESDNDIALAVFVPYYFRGDGGRNGLFVSPGLIYNKDGGDTESDGLIDFGVDVGIKKSMRENVVWRLAAIARTGDSFEDAGGDSQVMVGARFGLGVFWR